MSAAPELDRPAGRPASRVLTAVEFDVLWEWLGLGATPVVLRLDSPGRTYSERRRIVAAGWQGLRERGLADLAGPDPEIARLMHLLAAPATQLELRMRLNTPTARRASGGTRERRPSVSGPNRQDGTQRRAAANELRGVAAARPGATALAVRQDATVTLSSAPAPVSALLSALPDVPQPHPPAAARAVALPSADLDTATDKPGGGGRSVTGLLTDRGVAVEDAALVEAVLRGAVRRGQLSALAADQWGVLHRLPKVIGVLDTRHGRYVTQRATAVDGTEWTTLAGTDRQRLHSWLTRLLLEAEVAAARI